MNTSLSILLQLNRMYSDEACNLSGVALFKSLVKKVAEFIVHSSNYNSLPSEKLEMYVEIILVDAFERCMVFEAPHGGKSHAAP